MARVLLIFTFVLAFLIGVPVMVRLCDVVGPQCVVALSVALAVGAAWLGHTPESQAMADDFRGALRDAGISQKSAAITMGLGEGDLANQLNGREQLSAWRMARLGPVFDAALAKRRLTRSGGAAVIDTGVLCELVNAVQALTAEYRRPRMAKMTHSEVA